MNVPRESLLLGAISQNNNAIQMIEDRQYSRGILALTQAMEIFKSEMIAGNDTNEVSSQSFDTTLDLCLIHALNVEQNRRINLPPEGTSSPYVFRQPIALPRNIERSSNACTEAAAMTTFNLALAHHLLAEQLA